MNKHLTFLMCCLVIFFAWNGLSNKIHADGANKNQGSDEVVVISNPKTPAKKMRIVFNEELSIGEVEDAPDHHACKREQESVCHNEYGRGKRGPECKDGEPVGIHPGGN